MHAARRTLTTAIADAVRCSQLSVLKTLAALCPTRHESPTMNSIALSFIALTVLASFGVAVWAWLAMNSVDEELRSFVGFDGMHFDA